MRYFKLAIISLMLFLASEVSIAGNWNKTKNSNPISGELAAKSGKCKSSDLECLSIDNFSVRFPGSKHQKQIPSLSFFANRSKSSSCPEGYELEKGAGFVIDGLHVSTCQNRSIDRISSDFRSPSRVKFFRGDKCPSPYEGVMFTSSIVGCL
jgi:hypothetical protein